MPKLYAHPIHRHWSIRWMYRLFGMLFLYTSITLFPQASLIDTPLVQTLLSAYPTWWHILWDILITITILGSVSFLLKILLHIGKRRRLSKNILNTIQRWDGRMIRNFLTFDYVVTRWLIGVLLSIALWHALIAPVARLYPDLFHVPHYGAQPVIMVMGIIGLLLIIESIDIWQKKMWKYFSLSVRW